MCSKSRCRLSAGTHFSGYRCLTKRTCLIPVRGPFPPGGFLGALWELIIYWQAQWIVTLELFGTLLELFWSCFGGHFGVLFRPRARRADFLEIVLPPAWEHHFRGPKTR